MAKDPQRREMVLQALQAQGLRALASFSSSEVLLLTGYWPVMGASVAIMNSDGEVFGVAPEDEIELARATSAVEFIPYKPASLDKLNDLSESLHDPIRKLTKKLNLAAGKIGADLSAGVHPASYQAVSHFRSAVGRLLQEALPDAEIVHCSNLFRQLMEVKSDIELGLIRKASAIAGVGFRKAADAIAAGRRENEVAADIEQAFSYCARNGFERSKGYFFCMSGPNSYKASGAYARTRSRVLEEGDLVMIHANTTGDGYWTDITRTYVVGEPSRAQEKMFEAVSEARSAALASIKPGVHASAVDASARSVLSKHGYGGAFKHAVGHGVGFAAADDHAHPRLHPHSPDILEAGMTFNIEPAIYLEHAGGLRHCDVVACTPGGAEVLTDF